MSRHSHQSIRQALLLSAALATVSIFTAAPASAESKEVEALTRLLVAKGVITKEQADALAEEAKRDAAATPQPQPKPDDGKIRVTHVPEVVKEQLRAEIKAEVMEQAKAEKWAAPNEYPSWISGLKISGDVRGRYDGTFFPDGNAINGSLPDWNAINTGRPYDTSELSNPEFAPQLNADQDRNRYRIRARLFLDADLGDGFSTGIGIATGNNTSPVSSNQSLGQNGGNFSKYALWLDRAYIGYDAGGFHADVGRFENPFLSTEIVWDKDINFDGLAAGYSGEVTRSVSGFFTAGAFPVFNSSFNFATNAPSKFESHDKWLLAGQAGVDVQVTKSLRAKLAGAYYRFENVEGELSSTCNVYTADSACDTDETRPSFAQYGNSYRPLRLIASIPENAFGTKNLYQYFGLVSQFEPVAVTGKIDYSGFDRLKLSLTGEYIRNLAYDAGSMDALAINNVTNGNFDGGDSAYFVGFTIGTPEIARGWDWSVEATYRYVESDAVVDAFADSDFGIGGTNVQGFTFGGRLGVTKNVAMALRWMSADEVGGAPLSVDSVQFDLNAKF